jgi:hypothetical protein
MGGYRIRVRASTAPKTNRLRKQINAVQTLGPLLHLGERTDLRFQSLIVLAFDL